MLIVIEKCKNKIKKMWTVESNTLFRPSRFQYMESTENKSVSTSSVNFNILHVP
jgi:hypothetical protein